MKLEIWQKNLYSITFSQFVALAGHNLIFPFLPFYIQSLGVEKPGEVALWTGVLGTVNGVAMFVSAPLWGALSDRFGRKPMLLRAYLGGAVALGLQGAVGHVWQLAVLRFLQGAFVGTVPASNALVAAGTPQRRLGYAMGLLQIGIFTSGFVGPLVGGVLASAVGFRNTFYITGGIYALAFLLLFFAVEERFERPHPAHREGFVEDLRVLASSRTLLVLAGVFFFLNATPFFTRPIIPLIVQSFPDVINATKMSSFVFAATALTGSASALAAAHFAARAGYRRVLALTAIGSGLAYIPVALADNVAALVLLMAFVGLFAGGGLPAANALIALHAPKGKQGAAFGATGSALAMAMATGPLLGGVTASWLGIHSVFPIAGAAMIGVGTAVLLLLPRPAKGAAESEEPALEGRSS